MKKNFRFSDHPEFENPSMIIGWGRDSGKVSTKVIEFLNEKLKGKSFCEIEPEGFFPFASIAIENDIACFPENRFYYCRRKDLVIFKGNEPRFEQYKFLNTITDLAQNFFRIKEFYTISGTISLETHTGPRKLSAVFNQRQIQEQNRGYGLLDMDWEGPPAISSYLLWIAESRGIPGVSLWPHVPFYMAAGEDLQAVKQTLSFLDKKFNLGLDLRELDKHISEQNTKIDRLREQDSEIDKYISMLEGELSLSEQEQLELTIKVTELLGENS